MDIFMKNLKAFSHTTSRSKYGCFAVGHPADLASCVAKRFPLATKRSMLGPAGL